MNQQAAMLPFGAAHQLFMQQLMLQQAMHHAAGQHHSDNPPIDIAALFAAATHANNNK
jgi:hypothetical protein